jgi:hypothetical protein
LSMTAKFCALTLGSACQTSLPRLTSAVMFCGVRQLAELGMTVDGETQGQALALPVQAMAKILVCRLFMARSAKRRSPSSG